MIVRKKPPAIERSQLIANEAKVEFLKVQIANKTLFKKCDGILEVNEIFANCKSLFKNLSRNEDSYLESLAALKSLFDLEMYLFYFKNDENESNYSWMISDVIDTYDSCTLADELENIFIGYQERIKILQERLLITYQESLSLNLENIRLHNEELINLLTKI